MPIIVTCDCGAKLRAQDEHAGKKTRCPRCGALLVIPADGGDRPPDVEPVEEEPPRRGVVAPPPAPRPSRASYGVSQEDEPAPRRRPARDPLNFDDEDDDKPRRPRPRPRPRPTGGDGWGINAGVGGGILMMVIAIIWFVVGLMFDWVFFYPPILFIIGLIALIKGLASPPKR